MPLQQSVTQVLRHTGSDLVQQSTSKLSSFTQLQRIDATLANEDPSGGTVQLTCRWEGPVWCVTSVPTAGGGGAGQAPTYIRRWLDKDGSMVFEMSTPAPGAGGAPNGLVTAVRRFTRVGGPPPSRAPRLEAEPRSRDAVPPHTPRGSSHGRPRPVRSSNGARGQPAAQAPPPVEIRRGHVATQAAPPSAPPDDVQLRGKDIRYGVTDGPAPQHAAVDVFGDEDDLAELDTAAVPRPPPPPPPAPAPLPPPPPVVATGGGRQQQAVLRGESCEEETHENQRGVPGVGYSTAFLMAADPPAWSTSDGKRCVAATPGSGGSSGDGMSSHRRDSDTQLLPVGWTWQGPWRVGDTALPVDADGWCYAPSFGAMAGDGAAASDGPGMLVRRRRWVRTRVRQEHLLQQQQRQPAPPMSPVIESPQQQPQPQGRASPYDTVPHHRHQMPTTPPPTPPVPDVRPDAVMRTGGRAPSGAHDNDTSFDSEISTTEADLHGRGAHAEWLRRSAAAAAVEQVGRPRDGAGGGAPVEKTPWRLAEEEIAAALAATRARRAGSASARGASSRASSRTGGIGDDAESVMTDVDLDVRSRAASLSAQQPLRRAARDRLRRGGGSGASSVVSDLDALVPGSAEAHDMVHGPRTGGASSNTDSVPSTPVDPQHTIFARAGTLNETLRRAAVTTGAYTALHPGDASDVLTDATVGSTRRRERLAAHNRPAAPALAPARQGTSHRGNLGRSSSSTSSLDGAAGMSSGASARRHAGGSVHRGAAAASNGVAVKDDESWVIDRIDGAVAAFQASVSAAAWSCLLAAWSGTIRLVTRHTRAVVAVLVAHAVLMMVV